MSESKIDEALWRKLAGILYQACGAYDMPERVMDVLAAAKNGEDFSGMLDGVLPVLEQTLGPYRGLTGSVEFDEDVQLWHGKLWYLSLYLYDSPTLKGLEEQFQVAVDKYHGISLVRSFGS